MFCVKCGAKTIEDSSFCEGCGHNLIDNATPEEEAAEIVSVEKEKEENTPLWDKFVEIFTANSEDKEQYNAMSSGEARELRSIMNDNSTDKILGEYREYFDNRPYHEIRNIKATYTTASNAGYSIWLAEKLIKNKKLKKPKDISTDKFRGEWKKMAVTNYKKNYDKLTNEVTRYLGTMGNYMYSQLLEQEPQLEDMSEEIREEIKNTLLLTAISSYFIGACENKYRK